MEVYKVGYFYDAERELAQACLDYLNGELVLPEKGTIVEEDGKLKLAFGGLSHTASTREKLYNAYRDFFAGWSACNKVWNAMDSASIRKMLKARQQLDIVTNHAL